jgi:hypothetical protein
LAGRRTRIAARRRDELEYRPVQSARRAGAGASELIAAVGKQSERDQVAVDGDDRAGAGDAELIAVVGEQPQRDGPVIGADVPQNARPRRWSADGR